MSIFQSLEKRLAEILRLSYNQCPTVEAQLRLLEVFEGVSGRELVQVGTLAIIIEFNYIFVVHPYRTLECATSG